MKRLLLALLLLLPLSCGANTPRHASDPAAVEAVLDAAEDVCRVHAAIKASAMQLPDEQVEQVVDDLCTGREKLEPWIRYLLMISQQPPEVVIAEPCEDGSCEVRSGE